MAGAERTARRGLRPSRGRAAGRRRLVPMGPVPQRAAVGHGARGLQRRRRRVVLLPARPRPLPCLPVGRGRHGRLLRHRAAAVPVVGAVERERPDPQGADVRAHRRPGQSRRGRQGVLVVPRRRSQPRPEPLALPLPAGGVPVRRPDRRERPPGQVRPGVRAARHRRVRRRPLLGRRGRVPQGRRRRPDHGRSGHQRRAGRRDAPRAADGMVPQHVELGPRCAQAELGGAARRRHRDRAPVLR